MNAPALSFPLALLTAKNQPDYAPFGESVAQSHLRRGLKLYVDGLKLPAMYHYRLALRLDPASALGHYLLGLALFALGETVEADAELHATLAAHKVKDHDLWAHRQAASLLNQNISHG